MLFDVGVTAYLSLLSRPRLVINLIGRHVTNVVEFHKNSKDLIHVCTEVSLGNMN